ncbi:MAG: leucine-rich repeat domain-containing protein [Bacteroidales bacterium]|nr:leucine-rich repeat domain-containing protein [Bacteroidales bacterium]
MFAFCASSVAQNNNRAWWNSLSPGWKKIFQDLELKGKNVEPNDEQLESMVAMQHVSCAGNKQIESLKPLARLTMLKTLDCSNTNVASLEGIEGLVNLESIDCSNNDNINSLLPLASLGNLVYLNCGNTMVKNLKPLQGLRKLQRLDVHFCTVNSLQVIGDLKSLTELNVSENNCLFSLDGVDKLPQLLVLDCSYTHVDDLTPLQSLKLLEVLNVSNTDIKTTRSLQYVRTLKDVDCSNTAIQAASLDYFYSHVRLQFLRARNIDISQKQVDDFTASFVKKNVNCDVIVTKK